MEGKGLDRGCKEESEDSWDKGDTWGNLEYQGISDTDLDTDYKARGLEFVDMEKDKSKGM